MTESHASAPPSQNLSPPFVRVLLWMWGIGVGAIVVMSLTPGLGPPSTYNADRILHCIGYAGAAGVPFAAFASWRGAWMAALAMAPMGIALEIAQHWIPGRFTDPWDGVANIIGVVIGCLIGPRVPGWIAAIVPRLGRAGR